MDSLVGLTDAQLASVSNVDSTLLRQGQEYLEAEKAVSAKSAFKTHYKAAMWSVMLSCALVMEGYDLVIINSFFGQPAFNKKFGHFDDSTGRYIINANFQSAISNVASVGQLIGLLITGTCQEKFGSRRTYIAGMTLMILTIFLAVFAQNLPMLLVAELLMGLPWGMFQTLTTAYAAEICPISLRGFLASFVNMAWGIGIFLSSGVAKASLDIPGEWSWRMPFAVQWVWPVPLLIGAIFIPESPWWLVRKGRLDDAKRSMIRLAKPDFYANRDLDAYIAVMKFTDDIDKVTSAQGSYRECFRGTNLRRTEIMLGVWLCQIWCGQYITGYAIVFFETAGLSTDTAFDLNLSLNSMFIIGTIISWLLLPRFGRRSIWLSGLLGQSLCLIAIGICGVVKQTRGAAYTAGAFMILINLIFNCTQGPVCYTIAGELPSSRVRSRSIMMGRWVYSVCGIAVGQLNPRMMNPTAWNWQAKAGWFWLGTNALCCTWAFFRLPETGGFSFAQLDILFANKISARHFTKVKIDEQIPNSENEKGDQRNEYKFVATLEQAELA